MFERCYLKHYRKMDTSDRLVTVIFIFVVMLVPQFKGGALPEPDLNCPKVYAPVCGSNNKTYNNGCELERANCQRSCKRQLTVQNLGKCGQEDTNIDTEIYGCEKFRVCLQVFIPVCGTDGVTYGNQCMLDIFNCRRCSTCEKPCKVGVRCAGECKECVSGS